MLLQVLNSLLGHILTIIDIIHAFLCQIGTRVLRRLFRRCFQGVIQSAVQSPSMQRCTRGNENNVQHLFVRCQTPSLTCGVSDTRYGQHAARSIIAMAKSVSSRYTDYLLEQVRVHKPVAADYIANTDDLWRSTDRISSERQIPPRYGIVTSNTCECVNYMFGEARSLGWLECIDKLVELNLPVSHEAHGQGLHTYCAKSGSAPASTRGRCCSIPKCD
jgi:hypothetical protein